MATETSPFGKSLPGEIVIRLLTLAIWIVVLIRYAILIAGLSSRTTQYDFSLYYTSALALRSGIDPYFFNLAHLGRPLGLALPDPFTSNYTPLFVAAFEPLTRFSVDTAYWLWFAISTCALIAALTILFAEYEISGTARLIMLGLFMLFPGVTAHFQFAQSQFVLLLILVLMLYGLRHDRNGIAGAALAVAIMFKVFPIVMTGCLVSRRRWRAIGWTIGTLIVGTALLLPEFSSRDWLQFFKNTGQSPYYLSYYNISPAAFLSRLYWHLFTVEGNDLLRHAIIAGFDLVIVATAFYASIRDGLSPDLGLSLWLIAMLLLSPLVWIHYLPLLIIPAIQVERLWRLGYNIPVGAVAMMLGFALIFMGGPITDYLPHHGVSELLSEYGVAALLLIYFSGYALARRVAVDGKL
jgi:Glycosyltransferase family 87